MYSVSLEGDEGEAGRVMEAIGLHEVGMFARGVLPKAAVTTAHLEGYRFYRKRYAPSARVPMVDRLARSCSPFALDTLLEDIRLFMRPDTRTARRWQRAAQARRAELQGVVMGL